MTNFAPSEENMWLTLPRDQQHKLLSDDQINEKYASKDWRIVTEFNREQLPNFVSALDRPGWMDVRPFYQRRPRWEIERQSRLIESFIMNIPVPPLFVYESDLAKYEVMDGQQRITTLRLFYSNQLILKGLEQWPELNGRNYAKLPSDVRKGLDRRSISYTVLLKESAETSEEQMHLRQLVFERLNTGGIKLAKQEIRNCLYHSSFNELLIHLAKNGNFRSAWSIPLYTQEEETRAPDSLLNNSYYTDMGDAELILRFFALRHSDKYRNGMNGFLDIYMNRARKFTEEDILYLGRIFNDTIELAINIFSDLLFRPWIPEKNAWALRPQVAFWDSVMVGLSRNLSKSAHLLEKKTAILEATKLLFINNPEGTFTGRGNTKEDVTTRINLFSTMLESV